MQKVEPYVPLQRMPGGDAVFQALAAFYGIGPAFPAMQLLAHNERLKTVHYVTAAARRALDASRPSALASGRPGDGGEGGADGGDCGQDMLNVVVAGTKMFEKDDCDHCECRYRICQDGLPFLLPFLSEKRVAPLARPIVVCVHVCVGGWLRRVVDVSLSHARV